MCIWASCCNFCSPSTTTFAPTSLVLSLSSRLRNVSSTTPCSSASPCSPRIPRVRVTFLVVILFVPHIPYIPHTRWRSFPLDKLSIVAIASSIRSRIITGSSASIIFPWELVRLPSSPPSKGPSPRWIVRRPVTRRAVRTVTWRIHLTVKQYKIQTQFYAITRQNSAILN